jgi:hypothetical protein
MYYSVLALPSVVKRPPYTNLSLKNKGLCRERACLFLARFCRERLSRACPLCPGISDVDLFRYRKCIIDLNAEVSDGAFDFCVTEQELNGS